MKRRQQEEEKHHRLALAYCPSPAAVNAAALRLRALNTSVASMSKPFAFSRTLADGGGSWAGEAAVKAESDVAF